MSENDRIYISIAARDRKRIAALSLSSIFNSKAAQDFMVVSNDGSTEYSSEWVNQFADQVRNHECPLGIQTQRRLAFHLYWENRDTYPFLYLTDADMLHDPGWRARALDLYHRTNAPIVCLYNTEAHTKMPFNVFEDNPEKDHFWTKYAPGCSYLLHRSAVARIMPVIGQMQHWDWFVPSVLRNRCCISRTSYVDHLGFGGERHPEGAGYNGGDRATNPTEELVHMREIAVAMLTGEQSK